MICKYIVIMDIPRNMKVLAHITCKYKDVDPQRDNDASPISSYRCMLRLSRMLISSPQHKSEYKSKFNFKLFEKKFKILDFHVVVLMKNFPMMYQLIM